MNWQPIETAPDGGVFLGYEAGDFGPAYYGVLRGPFGDLKLAADPEFEVYPTHWAPIASPDEPVSGRAILAANQYDTVFTDVLRKILRRASAHPDDTDTDRIRDLSIIRAIARDALGEL